VRHDGDVSDRLVSQSLREVTASDGTRIAFARLGDGPPLVRAAHWLSHLVLDWYSPVWRHWLTELSRDRMLVRYDERGTGLSDHEVRDLSFAAMVGDLEAVVDSLELPSFDLFGSSQGGAIAIAYAVRHPERVRRLVLYGAFAQGRRARATTDEERDEADLLVAVVRHGWGTSTPAFRRVFASLFLPDAEAEVMASFDELQRASTDAETAARLREMFNAIDVSALASRITVPTLVLHARGDDVAPFDQGRLLATLIPDARFVPLDSRNHILLANEPAWPRFLAELRAFLDAGPGATSGFPSRARDAAVETLSTREAEVLGLAADGITNIEIAARLGLSVRTVERHLSNVYLKLGIEGKAARAAAAARLARNRAS
jgi:pimeloyl-ACP methyl ester carboxylesterase